MARVWVAANFDAGIICPGGNARDAAAPRGNALRAVAQGVAHLRRGTMLRLRVVSEQRRSLAERSSAPFSVEGGTIGRSADNDWVLPDPHRYVSAHHARVQFREGHFYLQDVSTNGTYVNDDMEPLAKRGSSGYRLADGDVLRMGQYHILAAVEARRAEPEPLAAVPTNIQALRPVSRLDRDIGAALNLDDLLQPPGESEPEAVLPVNAFGQAVDSGRVHALARAQQAAAAAASGPHAALASAEHSSESVSQRMARLAEAVARDAKHNTGSIALEDIRSGLDAFCRGAGIAAETLPADAQGRLLHLAGRLFREAFVGLKELERTRRETRNRYRIESPAQEADDPRPSLSDSMVEDLLVALFLQHEGRRLDSVQWLREAVGEAKQH